MRGGAFLVATLVLVGESRRRCSTEAPRRAVRAGPRHPPAALLRLPWQGPPKKPKGKLNLFERGSLLDAKRKIVVAKAAADSELIKRIEDADSPMPPAPRPKLSAAEKDVLRRWVAVGAPAWPDAPAGSPALAGQVKELFRSRCLECHGGSKTQAGVKILDHAGLLAKKKLTPGKPDESVLFQLITASDDAVMPPAGQPRLLPPEVELVRQWIAAGAPAFPDDVAIPDDKGKDPALKASVGVEYIFKKILEHVRTLPADDRPYIRFFSINHLAAAGATRQELDLQRDALAKAINHLSWERKLALPTADRAPANTVFAVDLRELGWHRQPFERLAGRQARRQEPLQPLRPGPARVPLRHHLRGFGNLRSAGGRVPGAGRPGPADPLRPRRLVRQHRHPAAALRRLPAAAVRPRRAGRPRSASRPQGNIDDRHRQAGRHDRLGRLAEQSGRRAPPGQVRRLLEELRLPLQQGAGEHVQGPDPTSTRAAAR